QQAAHVDLGCLSCSVCHIVGPGDEGVLADDIYDVATERLCAQNFYRRLGDFEFALNDDVVQQVPVGRSRLLQRFGDGQPCAVDNDVHATKGEARLGDCFAN